MIQSWAVRLLRAVLPSQYNDWILRPTRVQTAGAQPQTDKIAIFLIFPKYGLLDGHIHSLRYMVDNGYSPLVVSNLPLSSDDLARLKPLAWRIMQRQNFGYDFGGYRDAVLDLAADLPHLQRLVFLNDSCWFPMQGSVNFLALAESSGKDVFAADKHRDAPRALIARNTRGSWRFWRRWMRPFFASYAMSLGPKVLQSPKYLRFWQRLVLSDRKGRTVRRGEKGHSNWLTHRDFTTGSLINFPGTQAVLSQLSLAEFDHLWLYFRLDLPAENDTLSPEAAALRRQIRVARLQRSIINESAARAIPHFAVTKMGFPFLRKLTTPTTRDILRNIIVDLDDPLTPAMLDELAHRARS